MARSKPLTVSKETGEPTTLPWNAHKNEPWKVVVVDIEGKRKSKKFFSYVEAKETAARLREKFGVEARVAVVSRCMGYGPPHSKVSTEMLAEQNDRGNLWCPYCRTFRRFLYNAWREREMCEVCGCVVTDFHVRANNPVFWDRKVVESLIERGA